MAAAISWTTIPAAQISVQPVVAVQAAARTAEQLRATLMSLAPASQKESRQRTRAASSDVRLVDVRTAAPSIVALSSPPWSAPTQRFLMRPELAERLELAARLLPDHLSLGIWEGFRPLWVQRAVWDTGLQLLSEAHPTLDRAHLEDVLDTYIARPDSSAPHSQGKAADIAVLDASGQVLEADTEEGRLALQEFSRALSQAGLSNYAPEWWHWSYEG